MEALHRALEAINDVLWHDVMLFAVLGAGVLFTLWTRLGQWQSLTHGVAVVVGRYDSPDATGALRHFEALSAALSATVGLGNIGGVALAIGLGGPGAVFWMWVIGLVGMALKTAEVTLSMLHRDAGERTNPHGGPMFVAERCFAERGRPGLGRFIGGVFVVTLIAASITGGNMFQAWNVAEVSHQYFQIPKLAVGLALSVMVALVILGGIRRIGLVAGKLVPTMCLLYLLAAVVVLVLNAEVIPDTLRAIFDHAFAPTERQGAFIGGTAGYALLWGMKRALFSSEAGQGSSPIAHCAARTDEPVREGVVAGLEPFIDTLVVCTLTSLVILSSGVWSREPDMSFPDVPAAIAVDADYWSLSTTAVRGEALRAGQPVFTIVQGAPNGDSGNVLHRLSGELIGSPGDLRIEWRPLDSPCPIEPAAAGAWIDYRGASLTARAFDHAADGLGKWLVTLAAWLFAFSTMISWSYYAEQGVIFLWGPHRVRVFKILYCILIVVATIPALIRSDQELDDLTTLGTGLMLWANLPILLLFGPGAMRAYRQYFTRHRRGDFSGDDRQGG